MGDVGREGQVVGRFEDLHHLGNHILADCADGAIGEFRTGRRRAGYSADDSHDSGEGAGSESCDSCSADSLEDRSRPAVSCETLHVLDGEVGACAKRCACDGAEGKACKETCGACQEAELFRI